MDAVASISDRVTDLGAYLREQRESAKLSVRQLASLAGVSNPYLSQVERGLRKPSAEMLQQIAKGLRISAEALYVRAGILDEEIRVGVERAVHADPDLSDRQKRVLLDIYASFRAENARAAAEDVAASVPRRRPSTRTTSSVPEPAKRAAKRAAKAAAATDVTVSPRPAADTSEVGAPAGPTAGAAAPAARRAAKRGTKRTTTRARTTRSTRTSKVASKEPAPEPTPERPDTPAVEPASGPTTPSAGTPDIN